MDLSVDKGKGSLFFLAKGQILQIELLVAITEESELLRTLIFYAGIWPRQKCQLSEAMIHDLTNELEGKPIELGRILI